MKTEHDSQTLVQLLLSSCLSALNTTLLPLNKEPFMCLDLTQSRTYRWRCSDGAGGCDNCSRTWWGSPPPASPGGRWGRCLPPPECSFKQTQWSFKQTHHFMSKASSGGRWGRCPLTPRCSFKQTHHWVKHLQEADGACVLLLLNAPLNKHITE